MTIDSTPDAAATEPRSCTVCLARDRRRPATHVARDAGGLEWFECGSHDPTDNVAETVRVALEPIATWFQRRGVPLPGGATKREPAWLVKDFSTLYRAAKQALEAAQRDGLINAEFVALQVHVTRLAPAFDTCEWERGILHPTESGAPDRLTPGERFALTGLHRWLHSPGGDCELTESAQPYHDQCEAESPADCERLDAEETRAYPPADDPTEDLTPAAGVQREPTPRGFELTAAARDYYASDLRYRAPEHLSARDRAIIAAVDADEASRAESPDEWLGPEVEP